MVIIPRYQPEKGIDSYGGKDFEKISFKTRVENVTRRSTSGLGPEYDDGEELGDDEGLNW